MLPVNSDLRKSPEVILIPPQKESRCCGCLPHPMPLPRQCTAHQFSKPAICISLPEGFLWTKKPTLPTLVMSYEFPGTDTTKKQLSICDWWTLAPHPLNGRIPLHALLWASRILHGIESIVVTGLITCPFLTASPLPTPFHFPITLPMFSEVTPEINYLHWNSHSGLASGETHSKTQGKGGVLCNCTWTKDRQRSV